MRMKTYKKRRKSKSKEEYIIRYLMNKCKVSKKDIGVSIFKNKNGKNYKCYICANKTKLSNQYITFGPLTPYARFW